MAAGGHRPTIITIEREPDNKGFAITLLILGGAAPGGTALTGARSMIEAGFAAIICRPGLPVGEPGQPSAKSSA